MKRVCSPSELEIKTDHFYSLHKHHYSIHICLLIESWRFLNFRSEPRLRRRLATSKGAMQKLRINSSPAASWGWYITLAPHFRNGSCRYVWARSYRKDNEVDSELILSSSFCRFRHHRIMKLFCVCLVFPPGHIRPD